jgi:hypothetical protein
VSAAGPVVKLLHGEILFPMKTVTYPYGTQRKATVIETNWRPEGLNPRACAGTYLVDEKGEGHISLGDVGCDDVKKGDVGTLTFTKGGPTGGYWRFSKHQT